MAAGLGELTQAGAGLSQPGGGNRIAIGPGSGRRRTLGTQGERGKIGVGQLAGALQRREPLLLVPANGPGGATGPVLADLGIRLGGSAGQIDQCGVGQDPAWRDVALDRDGVPGLPQLTDHGDATAVADLVHPRGAPPRVDPDRGAGEPGERVELLLGPHHLVLRRQVVGHEIADLTEHLDVEGGVTQPGLRQGSGRPVHGRVLLGKAEAEVVLDDRGEPNPRQTHEASPELGVEQARRMQTDLRQAGQVLGCGMQDPLDVGDDLGDG